MLAKMKCGISHHLCESDHIQNHQAEVVGWGKLCLDAKTWHEKPWLLEISATHVLSLLFLLNYFLVC
jgi:hypothetical protein